MLSKSDQLVFLEREHIISQILSLLVVLVATGQADFLQMGITMVSVLCIK